MMGVGCLKRLLGRSDGRHDPQILACIQQALQAKPDDFVVINQQNPGGRHSCKYTQPRFSFDDSWNFICG